METKDLKHIINNGESQTVEFKERWPANSAISKVICSFANTSGGVLTIGVDDGGKVVGLSKEHLDVLQKRVSESNKAVSPTPLISITDHSIDDKRVIAVEVKKAYDQGYHTYEGAIYVRVGSTTQRLDGATQLDYLRQKQILSFDETLTEHATIEDIDAKKIATYLEMRGNNDYLQDHTVKEFLLTNNLARAEDSEFHIKNSALLLFGKEPIKFIPQAEIKLVQFAGSDPVDILDYKLLKEDLVNAIQNSIQFIRAKMSKSVQITGNAKREEVYEYPLSVIRETLVNALVHRDYFSKDSVQISMFTNRLEVTSPGALPTELAKGLFGSLSVQRNPITYRILRDIGFVEGLGTGVPRIRNEMKKAGLPDPEFVFTEHFTRIVLFNNKEKSEQKIQVEKKAEIVEKLNERQLKALEYLKTHEKLKAKKYSDINEVSYATAVNEINMMVNLNLLEKVGAYRGAYYILKK